MQDELNILFSQRKLASASFYEQLMSAGFLYQRSTLLEFFPDGGGTFCGVIVRQDNKVFRFDIDVDVPTFSEFEDVSDERKIKSLSKELRRKLKAMGVLKNV